MIALIVAGFSACNMKAQNSFASLLYKARHGDGAAYFKLADCYRNGDGVKRDFFNMITMAEMYGHRINDYINGLPDDDEYKTDLVYRMTKKCLHCAQSYSIYLK